MPTLYILKGARTLDELCGYYHGTCIPLQVVYPNAQIPGLQMTLARPRSGEAPGMGSDAGTAA
ncbi:MAG: hypothetical protein JNL84_13905 [Candidatus Accumulibacter sp.]|nr:hypothetical protein [Accumulibacter sp.]